MSKAEAVIIEAMEEQEILIASEKLGGNIVKEEFHKGALFGLRVAMSAIDEHRTSNAVEPAPQPITQVKTPAASTPEGEIAAHLLKLESYEYRSLLDKNFIEIWLSDARQLLLT